MEQVRDCVVKVAAVAGCFFRVVKVADKIRKRWMLLAPERMFELDAVAIEIVKRIDGTSDLGAIVDDLAATFNAERSQILADVLEFLGKLADKRAIDT